MTDDAKDPRPDRLPVVCPNCLAMDKPHASATIEVDNGTYTCIACGYSWPKAVDEP